MAVDRGKFIPIILDLIKQGFADLLDPSNDPEFFWQVIWGPPVLRFECNVTQLSHGILLKYVN
jgi:hypothetical protein